MHDFGREHLRFPRWRCTMREPARFPFLPSTSDSWLRRVQENARDFFLRSIRPPTSANGAPIHLLSGEREHPGGSHAASFLVHAVVIGAILAIAKWPPPVTPANPLYPVPRIFAPSPLASEHPSPGRKGGGGEGNPEPARHGFLPPFSAIQLAPPRLPDQQNHPLPVTVTILDPEAPSLVSPISKLGLPDSVLNTNSAGPGRNGIGDGKNGGAGNDDGNGDGVGDESGPPGMSLPMCVYCPVPVYTDEARHVKIQGTVTLRVKVGSDGRASDIRIARGLGYGLEERAKETVSTWKFRPARDPAGRVTPAWITVEAVFRLF